MQPEITTKHSKPDTTKWADLLREAVTQPGLIHSAYTAFHGYSIGNQLLAMLQCHWRGIQPGPIATYPSWKAKGRQVKRGQKAIVLCMPITCKTQVESDEEKAGVYTRFVYKPHWFVLSQTEGDAIELPVLPEWERAKALDVLGIQQTEFTSTNGNVLGYAEERKIAINPLNPMPWKTTFHELAHILLGHTTEGAFADGEHTPKNLREVEAESVALICCESLGLPGAEFSRGYIQGWLAGDVVPEKSAQKIFHVADLILKAGQTDQTTNAA